MPRDQETSLRNDPATSDDPLFRDRSGPARPDQDEYPATGDTPIGDELSANQTDAPGEWVAGSKGPHQTFGDDSADPAASADAGAAPDLRATRDPEVAPDTALAAEPGTTGDAGATRDPDAAWGPGVAHDASGTQDTEVVPDSETTPANGIPVVTAADVPPADATTVDATTADATTADTAPAGATRADAASVDTADVTSVDAQPDTATPAAATPADATPADATTATGGAAPAATDPSAATPETPVPGAPGTAPDTGVDATIAAFVTNGDELHAEWVRIQSSFVDDPRGSVAQAADLVSQVTNSLVTAVQQREQALRGTWDSQGGGDTDTEHLRNAFRDYRAFFERLAQL